MNKKIRTLLATLMLVPGTVALVSCDQNKEGQGTIVDHSIVSLSDTSVELYVGDTHMLLATTSPVGEMVTWHSENTDIATINLIGKITGVSQGTTRVYAELNGQKKYCTVTVLETTLDVEETVSLVITESDGELTFGTKQLSPKINEQAVTCTYSSSNTAIASVSADGVITANGVGTTTITVKYSETISKTVNVTVTGPEGFYTGVSAQSADVAKNAGKWFFHTAGSASNFKCYHLGDKVHLDMNNSGANQTFLRYQVAGFESGDVYQFTTTVHVNKDCYLKISDGTYTETFKILANTDTPISLYGLKLVSTNCLGFLFLASQDSTNYLKAFNTTIKDFTATESISIDKRNVVLNLEKSSEQLTASEDGVTWTSDNTEVVTVDSSGLISKVANGSTKVWATKGDKKCFVNVSVEDVKLALDKSVELIGVGNTLTITVDSANSSGINEANVVWASSDESVATVENGVVTAKKGGATVISATENGATASVVVGVYGEENKLTDTASNFSHKTTDQMNSVGPGWYKLNYNCDSCVINNGVITLTNNTKTFKDVQQIRYVPNDGNGNIYHGDYFIRYTVESGMKDSEGNSINMTCASQRNGDNVNVSPTATLGFGESETLQNVVYGVSDNSGFLAIKLKYPSGYGTITIKDIYIVKIPKVQ